MNENMVIYLDWDGVCVEDEFPRLGADKEGAVETLKDLVDAGYRIVLWTCRESHSHLPDLAHGIDFLYEDFRTGWKEGIDKSKSLGLYRQKYCGCIYSERDRYLNVNKPNSKIEREKNESTL